MDKDNQDVGYKKPPKETQFKKGQSGNPKGRPKGSGKLKSTKDLESIFLESLDQEITVTIQGKEEKITKYEALIHANLNQALQGDKVASQLIITLTKHFSRRVKDSNSDTDAVNVYIDGKLAKL